MLFMVSLKQVLGDADQRLKVRKMKEQPRYYLESELAQLRVSVQGLLLDPIQTFHDDCD